MFGWSTAYTSIVLSLAASRCCSVLLSWSNGTCVYLTLSPGFAASKPAITGANVFGSSGPSRLTVPVVGEDEEPEAEQPPSSSADAARVAATTREERFIG